MIKECINTIVVLIQHDYAPAMFWTIIGSMSFLALIIHISNSQHSIFDVPYKKFISSDGYAFESGTTDLICSEFINATFQGGVYTEVCQEYYDLLLKNTTQSKAYRKNLTARFNK
ncbi:hypothetical protein OAT84_02600, partial [Gammaproteobacteria bacterium]|nr:hypothetical protein [Gammaproteobacteria bacterium]